MQEYQVEVKTGNKVKTYYCNWFGLKFWQIHSILFNFISKFSHKLIRWVIEKESSYEGISFGFGFCFPVRLFIQFAYATDDGWTIDGKPIPFVYFGKLTTSRGFKVFLGKLKISLWVSRKKS